MLKNSTKEDFAYEVTKEAINQYDNLMQKMLNKLPETKVSRFIYFLIEDRVFDMTNGLDKDLSLKEFEDEIKEEYDGNFSKYIKDLAVDLDNQANLIANAYLTFKRNEDEFSDISDDDVASLNEVSSDYYADLGFRIVDDPNLSELTPDELIELGKIEKQALGAESN